MPYILLVFIQYRCQLTKKQTSWLTNLPSNCLHEEESSLKLTGYQFIKKFPYFMEHEVSLPHSQEPATCHHPEAHEQLTSPSHSLKIHFVISCHLRLGLPSGFFPSGSSTKTLYVPFLSPIRDTSPANSILLDFVNRIILGEVIPSLSAKLYICVYNCLYLCLGIKTVSVDKLKWRRYHAA